MAYDIFLELKRLLTKCVIYQIVSFANIWFNSVVNPDNLRNLIIILDIDNFQEKTVL